MANLTRDEGRDVLAVAARAQLGIHPQVYPLAAANQALNDLRSRHRSGAAVLVP